MDNKQIITIILTIIATGIVAPFTKSIFDKIFAAYNPDPKKINSGIKKIFLFILRYTVLIGVIIYIFQANKVVDKVFILQLYVAFSLLVLTIIFEFFYKLFISDNSLLINIQKVLKIHSDLLNKS